MSNVEVKVVGNMTPPIRLRRGFGGQAGGGANHWGNHMGLPLRGNDFSIDPL